MGYRTYMYGALEFRRAPNEEELQRIRDLLGSVDIFGLLLEKDERVPGAPWVIVPAEKTTCGYEMLASVRKVCQECEALRLTLTGELRLNGMDNEDMSRILVQENQAQELVAEVCWPDDEWLRAVMNDLQEALSKPRGTNYIKQVLRTLKKTFEPS